MNFFLGTFEQYYDNNAYEIQYGSHLVGELDFCFPDEGRGPKIRTRVKNYHSVDLLFPPEFSFENIFEQ